MDDSDPTGTRIPVSAETRNLVRKAKRGGETYDSVLQKMLLQYDPPEASARPPLDAEP